MKYKVLCSDILKDLINKVNHYLELHEGWKPVGGVTISNNGCFYQVIFKS